MGETFRKVALVGWFGAVSIAGFACRTIATRGPAVDLSPPPLVTAPSPNQPVATSTREEWSSPFPDRGLSPEAEQQTGVGGAGSHPASHATVPSNSL